MLTLSVGLSETHSVPKMLKAHVVVLFFVFFVVAFFVFCGGVFFQEQLFNSLSRSKVMNFRLICIEAYNNKKWHFIFYKHSYNQTTIGTRKGTWSFKKGIAVVNNLIHYPYQFTITLSKVMVNWADIGLCS